MDQNEINDDLLNLILKGYLERDFDLGENKITLRSLTHFEKKYLDEKFKYRKSIQNIKLVFELVKFGIEKINGTSVNKNELDLGKISPLIIKYFYNCYATILKKIRKLVEELDDFSRSDISRQHWIVFKAVKKDLDLKDVNEFQFYWIVANHQLDIVEENFYDWQRTEFTTKYICAFLNSKELNKLEKNFNVSKTLENILKGVKTSDDDNELKDMINADEEAFMAIHKKEEETKQEYELRVSEVVNKYLKENVQDEHARAVRNHEIRVLQKLLIGRRAKYEILREVGKAIRQNKGEREEEYQEIKQEFYHKNVNYQDIIDEKMFAEIPLEVKQQVFNEMMIFKLDLSKEIQKGLDEYRQKEEVNQKKVVEIRKDERLVDLGPAVLKMKQDANRKKRERLENILEKRKTKPN